MSVYRIEYLRKEGAWYWRLVASNGQILAHSESYSSRTKAVQTARKVAEAAGFPLEEPPRPRRRVS